MPRKSDHLTFAINFCKYQMRKTKTDAERRRMLDRFLFLTGLLPKEMFHPSDDNPLGKPTDNVVTVKEPSLDDRAAAMLKRLNGGDDGNDASSTPNSVSTN
jgi:hypothetical protein